MNMEWMGCEKNLERAKSLYAQSSDAIGIELVERKKHSIQSRVLDKPKMILGGLLQ